jgi:hypothetical protein
MSRVKNALIATALLGSTTLAGCGSMEKYLCYPLCTTGTTCTQNPTTKIFKCVPE